MFRSTYRLLPSSSWLRQPTIARGAASLSLCNSGQRWPVTVVKSRSRVAPYKVFKEDKRIRTAARPARQPASRAGRCGAILRAAPGSWLAAWLRPGRPGATPPHPSPLRSVGGPPLALRRHCARRRSTRPLAGFSSLQLPASTHPPTAAIFWLGYQKMGI